MKKTIIGKIPRRDFMLYAPCLMMGSQLSETAFQHPEVDQRPVMLEELSEKEKDLVSQSRMAAELSGFFGQGYSCAESILLISLRRLDLPEECGWAAAGFGGGMSHKNLCGFLTGGIMALGFDAGQLKTDRTEAKEDCTEKVKEYWTWWQTLAPLQCKDIRPPGSSSKICVRLGRLACAKIESLFQT